MSDLPPASGQRTRESSCDSGRELGHDHESDGAATEDEETETEIEQQPQNQGPAEEEDSFDKTDHSGVASDSARTGESEKFLSPRKNQQNIPTPPASHRQNTVSPPSDKQSGATPAGNKQQSLAPDTLAVFSPPSSSRSRRSTRAKTSSKLVYDQRYHPLDDLIRPSQAAKRRSMHGEKCPSADDDMNISSFSGCDRDADSDSDRSASEHKATPAKKSRKRVRFASRSPEPTRRSSRQKSLPKVSYDARVHPQDELLELAYAEDESASRLASRKRKNQDNDERSEQESGQRNSRRKDNPTTTISDDIVPESPDPFLSSPLSSPIEEALSLDRVVRIPRLLPTIQRCSYRRGSFPESRGRDFDIHTDTPEQQLAAERSTVSPLDYDHDDKENDVINPNLEPEPDVNSGVSIMPLSQHRSSAESRRISGEISMVSRALYGHDMIMSTPYGLGNNTAFEEMTHHDPRFQPEHMRLLSTGEHLPREDP